MSVFRESLAFLDNIGVYDVVLPLLLIFSIVYAILEKTKVFGVEKVNGKEVTRKNINAMVAFVAAFFVVASAQLVFVISELVSRVSLLLVTFVMFMILIGIFHKDEELSLQKGWHKFFMVLSFISILLIFLNAVGWLQLAWDLVAYRWDPTFVATIVLLAFMAGFIYYVTRNGEKRNEEE